MVNQLDKLKILPVNKTFVFHSPIEGKDVLVRTGTLSEGSCFFHSLLHAYSEEYVLMSQKERMKFVKRLRSDMADDISIQSWRQIGDGLISKFSFQENLNNTLSNFYNFISDNFYINNTSIRNIIKNTSGTNESKVEVFKILIELIPFEEGFEQNILPVSYAENEGKIEAYKENIVSETLKYLKHLPIFKKVNRIQQKHIIKITSELINSIVEEAEHNAYQTYIQELKNTSSSTDSYTIGLISDKFDRDIYFIDANSRIPYQTTGNIKNRKSIVMIWIDGVHYEIVGKLLSGNRIQREFTPEDPFIKKLNMFLLHPENIHENYPELVPYLPCTYKENGVSHSPSKSYASSDCCDNSSTNSD